MPTLDIAALCRNFKKDVNNRSTRMTNSGIITAGVVGLENAIAEYLELRKFHRHRFCR